MDEGGFIIFVKGNFVKEGSPSVNPSLPPVSQPQPDRQSQSLSARLPLLAVDSYQRKDGRRFLPRPPISLPKVLFPSRATVFLRVPAHGQHDDDDDDGECIAG